MPRYDAVIFDLFGTLVHTVTPTAYAEMLDELSALLGVSHGEFTTHWRSTIEERESGALGDIATGRRVSTPRLSRCTSDP